MYAMDLSEFDPSQPWSCLRDAHMVSPTEIQEMLGSNPCSGRIVPPEEPVSLMGPLERRGLTETSETNVHERWIWFESKEEMVCRYTKKRKILMDVFPRPVFKLKWKNRPVHPSESPYGPSSSSTGRRPAHPLESPQGPSSSSTGRRPEHEENQHGIPWQEDDWQQDDWKQDDWQQDDWQQDDWREERDGWLWEEDSGAHWRGRWWHENESRWRGTTWHDESWRDSQDSEMKANHGLESDDSEDWGCWKNPK